MDEGAPSAAFCSESPPSRHGERKRRLTSGCVAIAVLVFPTVDLMVVAIFQMVEFFGLVVHFTVFVFRVPFGKLVEEFPGRFDREDPVC